MQSMRIRQHCMSKGSGIHASNQLIRACAADTKAWGRGVMQQASAHAALAASFLACIVHCAVGMCCTLCDVSRAWWCAVFMAVCHVHGDMSHAWRCAPCTVACHMHNGMSRAWLRCVPCLQKPTSEWLAHGTCTQHAQHRCLDREWVESASKLPIVAFFSGGSPLGRSHGADLKLVHCRSFLCCRCRYYY
jgi:hypothetical protein